MMNIVDENILAKIICKAHLEKNVGKLIEEGNINKLTDKAIRIAVDREVATGWQKFLPEARAVLKALDEATR